MADHKRIFRVWTGVLVDMDNLSDELIGKWTRLGCRTAMVGTGGVLRFDDWDHVARFLRVPDQAAAAAVLWSFPGLVVDEEDVTQSPSFSQDIDRLPLRNSTRNVIVSWPKWSHYQSDSGASDRMRRHRLLRQSNVTPDRNVTARISRSSLSVGIKGSKGGSGAAACETCGVLVDYMNACGRTSFPRRGKYLDLLHARHQEHGDAACRKVIRVTARDWLWAPRRARGRGDVMDMSKWYRPGTIFRPTKFPDYLGRPDCADPRADEFGRLPEWAAPLPAEPEP